MNLWKCLVAAALWYWGSKSHTPRHFLDADERKGEKEVIAAGYAQLIPSTAIVQSFGAAYFFGWHPLSGPWKAPEIVSAALACLAIALRFWAVQTLDKQFTYYVGIRNDHK